MKTVHKIVIILALAAAVAVVLVAKHQQGVASSAVAGAVEQRTSNLPQLIDLGSVNCVACKLMAPMLEELKNEYEDQFTVIFYDVWENGEYAEQYGIKSIPTQIFIDAAGKELFRHEGFFSKEDMLNTWKELGYDMKGMN